ncbi:sensor histidine kinase [Chitinasiproducens palmae]|uniref:histidine kinase n=1 Tax=Chitinasiproducens palmae TaxID=1770053 RepID=A0A1H2PT74_9BURK|nr:ATP-binding protein [Chitinasiproducens palmae]SDV50298.1 two-component system, sensor histidine kinase RegB [Chitinasiproducens palmae]
MESFLDNGRLNLRHLFWLRCLAIAGQLTTIGVTQLFFGAQLPMMAMSVVVALEILFNALTRWRLGRFRRETDIELFGQLVVDVSALTVLLFLSGGTINPFISLYLPALAIGAAVLPARLAAVLALLAISCYVLLSFVSVPLEIDTPGNLFDYYRIGMWINFVLSAGLITWFVGRMSATLRRRDASLADAQQRMMRDERVVALGAQAATAAHEIGSPLSTIALLTEELREAAEDDPQLGAYAEDLALLEQQIGVCKAALMRLQNQATGQMRRALGEWLPGFVEQWRLRQPQVVLSTDSGSDIADVQIDDVAAVGQILTIVLDNAGRASAHAVSLSVAAHGATIRFTVCDRGPGWPAELRAQLGRTPVRSTQGGAGVGLYLAFVTAGRLGGTIELHDRRGQGACAVLSLPLRGGVRPATHDARG